MFCQISESQYLKLASSYHQYKHTDVRYYKQRFLCNIHTYTLLALSQNHYYKFHVWVRFILSTAYDAKSSCMHTRDFCMEHDPIILPALVKTIGWLDSLIIIDKRWTYEICQFRSLVSLVKTKDPRNLSIHAINPESTTTLLPESWELSQVEVNKQH